VSKFHDVTSAERRHQLITGGSGPVGGKWAVGGGQWVAAELQLRRKIIQQPQNEASKWLDHSQWPTNKKTLCAE